MAPGILTVAGLRELVDVWVLTNHAGKKHILADEADVDDPEPICYSAAPSRDWKVRPVEVYPAVEADDVCVYCANKFVRGLGDGVEWVGGEPSSPGTEVSA